MARHRRLNVGTHLVSLWGVAASASSERVNFSIPSLSRTRAVVRRAAIVRDQHHAASSCERCKSADEIRLRSQLQFVTALKVGPFFWSCPNQRRSSVDGAVGS
jgi:hypothetical protein